ncbi:MAG: phage gp6-like head-tail connector protein [Clostridia bacterium]|nr:phage gp6-like head-tail connector protein [Clostridia bacterium]
MTLSEAKAVLRIDTDDNDALVQSLCNALPDYIEVTTGMTETQQASEPLVKTVSGFLLILWYYSDHADDVKLQRTIDNLLKCITFKVDRTGNDDQSADA